MLRLAEETNIEVLRQAALLLERENQRLIAKVVALTKKLVGAKGEDAQKLLLRISELEHQLQQRNRSLFGDSSEKRPGPGAPAEKQKKPKRGHGPRKQPRLKCVERLLDLDEADKQCPKCGGALAEMLGQFEESEEITVIARQFVRERIKRKKYRCGCNACIETALPPEKLFPGARYSIDVWPEADDALVRANAQVRGGDELMGIGLFLDDHAWEAQARGDFQARLFVLEAASE